MRSNASRVPTRPATASGLGFLEAGTPDERRQDAQRRARQLVTAVAALPDSRRSAVILAKQRILDPQYPSRDTLESMAGLLAVAWETSA